MQLSIVIPTLNESQTIIRAISDARKGLTACGISGEIIVVDNGSSDETAKMALESGANVVYEAAKGYGRALHCGILAAKGPWILIGDADLSYDFRQIEVFAPFLTDPKTVDIVLGSRLSGAIKPGAMPWLHRRIGTPLLNWMILILFGLKTNDCNSGMRLIRRDFYLTLPIRAIGMEWATEMLVRGKIHNGTYLEVPICYYKDQRKTPSHLRTWRDGLRNFTRLMAIYFEELLDNSAQLLTHRNSFRRASDY